MYAIYWFEDMTACHITKYEFLSKYRRRSTINTAIRKKFIKKLEAAGLTDEVAKKVIENNEIFVLAVVGFIKDEGFGGYRWNGERFAGIRIVMLD